jgi:hypothetical protein
MRSLNLSIVIFILIAAMSFAVSGQATGGAVTGTVVDPNGAVVPNATIKMSNRERGQEFTGQTSADGIFLFPNVPVGNYTVKISAPGFGESTREAVVTLNQTATVDTILQAAGATGVVDVVAGSEVVVQTETSQVGKTFETRKVLDLPINNNVNNLAILAPNAIPSVNGTAGDGTASASAVIGGVRSRGNGFNIDGVDNYAPDVAGPSTAPIQDAIQEFTLLQNNFNAEFGAGAGGMFNTITKSGTNDYHGSVFTYINSQRFNAAGTDESEQGFKNFLKEVRWGGTFGGPLPYPHFGEGGPIFNSGKNKLFFFAAFEKYYQTGSTAADTRNFIAPTAAGLDQLAAMPGVSPFAINILRNNVTLAPNADYLSGITTDEEGNVVIPAINTFGVTGIPFGEVILPIPAFQDQNSFQFNVDHTPNDKNQFRYRYSRTRYLAEQAGFGSIEFNNNATYDTDLFSFNYIKTFSSSVVNDLRLSYLQTAENFPLKDPSFSEFPNIEIDALALAIGPGGNLPQNGYVKNYQVFDALTVVSGHHVFKFGGDWRRGLNGGNFLPRERGDYGYTRLDIFLRDDIPDNVNIRGVGSGAFIGDNHRFFTFFQDDWKVRPNLTLNLGVRYEYQGLFRDAALQATAANASVPGVIEFGVPQADKNNWAPRIGFAWAPNFKGSVGRFIFGEAGESSIRGNFSRAFFANFTNLVSISLPPTLQGELHDTGSATNFLLNGGAANDPFIPDLSPEFLRANAGSYIFDQIVPYTDSFAFSFQRQIGSDNALEIRYLRTRSKQMPVQVQLNGGQTPDSAYVIPTFLTTPTSSDVAGLPTIDQVIDNNPTLGVGPLDEFGFGGVLTGFPPIGKSNYDGVSFSMTRRFANNLGFTAAYTFSKTEDNSTNELNTSALNPRRPQDAGNFFSAEGLNIDAEWGPSPLDVPHRFVASFNYELPFFDNSSNAFLKAVFGGFSLNGIFQAQSGQPITIRSGQDSNLNNDAAGDRALFNPEGDPTLSSGIYAVNAAGQRIQELVNGQMVDVLDSGDTVAWVALNPSAAWITTGFLAEELAGNGAGTSRRNAFRTNGFNQTDLVVLKNTRFGPDGRFNFQIGAEIFDLFNQRPKTLTGVGAQTGAFAIAGNTNFNNYELGAYIGRKIHLRAKFIF